MFHEWKNVARIATCVFLFALIQSLSFVEEKEDGGTFGDIIRNLVIAIERNYTVEELLNMGESAKETFLEAPAILTGAIESASQVGQYGVPLDESSDDIVKSVYAVGGGRVAKVGVSKEYGLYVVIEHTDQISTYGHLEDIVVFSGDRIKKGDIVGSYDSSGEKEFYFDMSEKI